MLSSTCISNCKDPSDSVCSSTGTPGFVNHLTNQIILRSFIGRHSQKQKDYTDHTIHNADLEIHLITLLNIFTKK